MRIAVVGDTLLDVDMTGSADRLSPDAPVPVVSVEGSVARAGGAGLVATLLARDGAAVRLVTALGEDRRAGELRALLEGAPRGAIEVVAAPSGAATPVKTRVRAAGQSIVRLDDGCDVPEPPRATPAMLAALEDVDAVVVADYGRGVTADPRLRAALERAGRRVPLVWDPHPRGTAPVASAAVVTPNLTEALSAAGTSGRGVSAAAEAAEALVSRWGVASVLVTLGARGALLASRGAGAAHVVPVAAVAAADTCGAGDRLSAALATALASGAAPAEAAARAAAAAARFLASGGVGSLAAPAGPLPMGGASDALALAGAVRAEGGTVVATGGCFDLLHAGHARTLAAARGLGDCLIVCLNSDDSVRRLKGPERPIMSEADRRDLLMALQCVDAVVVFDEDTPEEVLRRIRPDIWVKGGDYVAADLPETAVLREWGGRTMTVPYHPGRSTTRLAGALARVG
ncbi:PfkB family carbohydrate kinase [Microbacterium album]|uniref:Bifunctional protein HldE n=1 Tax=Microbacterium album TaxID=2053191 RepID=A0A917IEQ6_9MICO|nr:PfkB family carbohydrate kinase [Microbacterium album]GGH45530.1 bifunctional protein HldE [Microbacterium album]